MIHVQNVVTRAGDFILDATLDIGNEYFVLLGMTGSGKTVFLESLCGLRPCVSGSIEIDGRDITAAEPRERNIGYVPQDGALFSHLTVAQNIEFGLKVNKTSFTRRREKVRSMAGLLGIGHLLQRKIGGLSGGERQRIALARALVLDPSMLVLDEPVSALDECTREAVCRELVRIRRELRIPVLHVCHSFEETSLIADRVGVMKEGRIVQTGTIAEVQYGPVDNYVARIFRHTNLFIGTAGAAGITVNDDVIQGQGPISTGAIEFLIRPWQINICNGAAAVRPAHRVSGTIKEVRAVGPLVNVSIEGRMPLSFFVQLTDAHKSGGALTVGCPIEVEFGPEAVHVFN